MAQLMELTISSLKHRIVLCKMEDVIENDQTMLLSRKDAYHAWAMIHPQLSSTFSSEGYTVKFSDDVPTHQIYVRFRSDINFSSFAWIFEERLKSSPRWFKVLAIKDVEEVGRFYNFACRYVERSDNVSQPVVDKGNIAVPLDPSVKL